MLGALVLLVLASRVWQARESLWLDELHTAWATAGGWADVAPRAADGNHSPVFFWLEWLFVRTLGASEFSLRLPSLVAGSLLPALLFTVTRRWTGSAWLGLLPAWFAAVDPQAIYFGTEARMYAVIQLLAVAHVALFASTLERPTTARRIALVLGMALLFHLHYTTLLLMAAEVSYFAVSHALGKRGDYGWRSLVVDCAAIALLASAALPGILSVYSRRGNWEAFVAQRPLWEAILTIPWATTAVVLAAIAIAMRLFGQAGSVAQKLRELPPSTMLALYWLLVPLLIAWLATATNAARLLHPRYVASAAPAALILAALAVNSLPWRQAQLALVTGLAIAAPLVSRIPGEVRAHGRLIGYRNDDWRSAIAAFNAQPGHGSDPVLVRSLLIESDELGSSPNARLRDYCLYPVTSLYRIDADTGRLIALRRTSPWALSVADLARVQQAPGFWLILGASSVAADQIEQGFLQLESGNSVDMPRAWEVSTRLVFGSVRVLRFQGIR